MILRPASNGAAGTASSGCLAVSFAFHHEEFGRNIQGVMLIGFETGWQATRPSEDIVGHWFESSTGSHYQYVWDVSDSDVVFWRKARGSDHAFKEPNASARRSSPPWELA